MPRSLSATARAALFAQETGEVFLFLLVLSHPSLSEPIRVCNDQVNTTSNGIVYVAFPFQLKLPPDDDTPAPEVSLSIDNVDRKIVEAVRRCQGEPITATLSIVLASSPNVLEAGPFDFKLRQVDYDKLAVNGTLKFDDILNEPFPGDTMTPSRFPGLF
ncbi:MAG: DUF1833 family protein [Phycisphaerales bacterium]